MLTETELTLAQSEKYRFTAALFGPELTHLALRLYASDDEIFNNVFPLKTGDPKVAEQVADMYGALIQQETPPEDHSEVLGLLSQALMNLALTMAVSN